MGNERTVRDSSQNANGNMPQQASQKLSASSGTLSRISTLGSAAPKDDRDPPVSPFAPVFPTSTTHSAQPMTQQLQSGRKADQGHKQPDSHVHFQQPQPNGHAPPSQQERAHVPACSGAAPVPPHPSRYKASFSAAASKAASNNRQLADPVKITAASLRDGALQLANGHASAPPVSRLACKQTYSKAVQANSSSVVLQPQQYGVNSCPFGHGTVEVRPFPGYVHGNHPEVCPQGCKPSTDVGKGETRKQTLLREAMEYQTLYHAETKSTPAVKAARMRDIVAAIEETGTYVHTFDELQHGARVAWRNAPKCANRKFAMELQLLDRRDVSDAQGMHAAALDMLERAAISGATETFLTAFPPAHPLKPEEGGPTVWNSQLLRYAGYRQDDMSILGDPSEVQFTELLQRKFGWRPPGGQPGRFNLLPHVMQFSKSTTPQIFEVPRSYQLEVALTHPVHPWFAELGLKWYGIPFVSNMMLTVGGILYTGAPFSGWYADTEILRNLSDESRYDQLPVIASRLGLNANDDRSLWKDAALVVLNQAILYSWQSSSIAMVDHHTLMKNFWEWYHEELQTRGYSPGNWKWIIPPIAAHTSKCYLGLNKMTEYTLRPAILYAPGYKRYASDWFGKSYNCHTPRLKPPQLNPYFARWVGRIKLRTTVVQPRVVLIYATVSGNSKQMSMRAARLLHQGMQVKLVNAEDIITGDEVKWSAYGAVLLVISTYGSGQPPGSATRFLKWLGAQGQAEIRSKLAGKSFSVLGLGSSAYPRFCAAAELLHALMLAAGGAALTEVHRCDAMGKSEDSFTRWLKDVVGGIGQAASAAPACQLLLKLLSSSGTESSQFGVMFRAINMHGLKRLQQDPQWTRGRVAEVASLLPVSKSEPHREVKLVKVDLLQGPASYEPGDHIAVLPSQAHLQEEIEALGKALGLASSSNTAGTHAATLDTPFDLELLENLPAGATDGLEFEGKRFPLPNTYRSILSDHVALLDLLAWDALAILAQYAKNEQEAAHMTELDQDNDAFTAWQDKHQTRWLELFEAFPSLAGSLPIEVFLQLVPLLHARYYSIASSHWAEPDQVHMVVARASWKLPDGSVRFGQASDYLTQHAPPGTMLSFKLVRVASFRLPMNVRSPTVYVAAGSGYAPLRGFLQHRLKLLQHHSMLGPCVLVFGCRSQPNMLCRQEIEHALKVGALTEVMAAYSRPAVGGRKEYVQNKVAEQGGWMRNMLRAPDAHIYVCGDSLMANAVTAAFNKVIGEDKVAQMSASGRYHEDVFGATQQKTLDKAKSVASAHSAQDALLHAAEAGDVQGVLKLLKEGAPMDASDSQGNTVLHIAATNNSVPLLQAVLAHARGQKKLPINAVNHWLQTPLAAATIRRHEPAAKLLTQGGGKLACSMHEAFYPLHMAALHEDIDEIWQLHEGGASMGAVDFMGATALHVACVFGRVDAVHALIECGAPVNMADRYGHTPLMAALNMNQKATVKALHSSGARLMALGSTRSFVASSTWNPADAASSTAQEAGLTPHKIAQCQAMWSYVTGALKPKEANDRVRAASILLFRTLFKLAPQLKPLFSFRARSDDALDEDLARHGKQVLTMLGRVVDHLTDLDTLMPELCALCARHMKYGVHLDYFDLLAAAMLKTMQAALGMTLSKEHEEAWFSVFSVINLAARRVGMTVSGTSEDG